MDRGAWRATVHRVTQSRTWLKGLNTHFCSANLSYNPVLYIPNAYSVWPLECLIDIANNEIQNWTSVSLATSALPTGFQWMAVPFFQLLRPKTIVSPLIIPFLSYLHSIHEENPICSTYNTHPAKHISSPPLLYPWVPRTTISCLDYYSNCCAGLPASTVNSFYLLTIKCLQ